ncbi:MAG: hypothetical protein QM786_19565 [Breznakibacter sp.]
MSFFQRVFMFLIRMVAAIVLFFGCQDHKQSALMVIDNAGRRSLELQKVIEHYRATGEKEKLSAAYFLIANIEGKRTQWHPNANSYFNALKEVTLLKSQGIGRDSMELAIRAKLDSIEQINGPLSRSKTQYINDLDAVSTDFLIRNIDLAFLVWEKPWANHLSFEQFCEYVLPYRIHDEPLSNWREVFYKQFICFEDSVDDPSDPKQLVEKISSFINRQWVHLDDFTSYEYYPSLVEMQQCNGGLCDHRYFLVTAIMRSIGLPVTIDFTPQWTNYTGGHAWNVLLDRDGRERPFNGGDDNFCFYDKNLIPMGDGGSICTKVYRNTYGNQKRAFPMVSSEMAANPIFKSCGLLDVTENYDIPKTKCRIKLDDPLLEGKIVYLSVFNYGWEINQVAWAKVNQGRADFGYIGLPAFYITTQFLDGRPHLIHSPLVMYKEQEKQGAYSPNLAEKRTVSLSRKFGFSGEFLRFANDLVGCKIQGSHYPDFRESIDLIAIDKQARAYEVADFNNSQPFRYVRLLSTDSADLRLAELEFWAKDPISGKHGQVHGRVIGFSPLVDRSNDSNFGSAFDGSIRTNLNAKAGSWVGLDLGKTPSVITRIWYLPRNNFNEIEHGHVYELFYLSDRWISLGRQKAESHRLVYRDVPQDVLLLLKNLSDGRQERIFMYDDESQEQIWW